ncbi:endonuclease Q family protein [bacterium]|nr:endonuclease Q family protein [bacterium]
MADIKKSRPGCVADLQISPRDLSFADLHIHSKYSRATSKQMEVSTLHYWGRRKGIQLLGTGDFTHPEYFNELKKSLEPDPSGFYRVKGQDDSVLFVPTAETSHMYKQDGKGRRVHMVMIARTFESVAEINRALASRGNVASDGRPIFGFSAKNLCKIVREIDPDTLMVPAHIWTPWFSVLGEKSGFDTLEACFEEELDFIAAIETGLSSDPEMNWRLSQLDRFAIISNSDAHSPARIGRECNAFSGPLTWTGLRETLLKNDHQRFKFTVEFFPEEGKYHWPGHSKCKQSVSPEDYVELNGICPICRKPLTHGVASRVEMLADRAEGYVRPNAVPSVHLVPLDEIIGEAKGKGRATKGVQAVWDRMVAGGSNELYVLMFMPEDQLRDLSDARVCEAIMRMRRGEVRAIAGYDGEYGRIKLFEESPESKTDDLQLPLIHFSGK